MGKNMFGIWDWDDNDWIRELPSKVNDGDKAILAFETEIDARNRALRHFGYDEYQELVSNEIAHVSRLDSGQGEDQP